MSGDPLSRKVFTPNASSTKSVPEVARPVDKRAMEPAHETTSMSGRQGKEEEEEVAVSCEDLQS